MLNLISYYLSSIISCYWKANLVFYKKNLRIHEQEIFFLFLKVEEKMQLSKQNKTKTTGKKEIYLEIYLEFDF